jgi:hypothetical protein
VRFDRVSPAPFSLDIGTTENLVVAAAAALDRDGVGGGVAGARAERRLEVHDDLGRVRAREVVDRDVVGAAKGVVVDNLDVVQVHHDIQSMFLGLALRSRSSEPRPSSTS